MFLYRVILFVIGIILIAALFDLARPENEVLFGILIVVLMLVEFADGTIRAYLNK